MAFTIFPKELESLTRLIKVLDDYFQDPDNVVAFDQIEVKNEDGYLMGYIGTFGHESLTFKPLDN